MFLTVKLAPVVFINHTYLIFWLLQSAFDPKVPDNNTFRFLIASKKQIVKHRPML